MIDYKVHWDQGSNSFEELATGVTATSYTKTGLTAGTTYVFKVKARNALGDSAFSSTVSILAASVPSTPSAPTTAISGSNVVVSWSAPTTNGSAITSYGITFKKNDNSFTTELTNCNGADSTIKTNRQCSIPKSVFSASPFSLPNTASVYAKVTATNSVGTSSASSEGNGALMATAPDAPGSVAEDSANTSHT